MRIDHEMVMRLYANHPNDAVRAAVCSPVRFSRAVLSVSTRSFWGRVGMPTSARLQPLRRKWQPAVFGAMRAHARATESCLLLPRAGPKVAL